MSDWKTIDSAPRDGTMVLGARNGSHQGLVCWDSGSWLMTLEGDTYAALPAKREPTHWMAVEAPPK